MHPGRGFKLHFFESTKKSRSFRQRSGWARRLAAHTKPWVLLRSEEEQIPGVESDRAFCLKAPRNAAQRDSSPVPQTFPKDAATPRLRGVSRKTRPLPRPSETQQLPPHAPKRSRRKCKTHSEALQARLCTVVDRDPLLRSWVPPRAFL